LFSGGGGGFSGGGGGFPGGVGGFPGGAGGFGGFGGGQSQFGGGGGGGGGGFPMDTDPRQPVPSAPMASTEIIRPLALTLEEIYKGVTKKFMVTKKRSAGVSEPNPLEVKIKPGYRSGTKIKFKGAGGEHQDMVFVLEEKVHDIFKRDGDDLIMMVKVCYSLFFSFSLVERRF
jgi:DnaJ family protein B protein 4